MKDIIKQLFCSHRESIDSVKDSTGWVIGSICEKCNKFWMRKDIPNRDERYKWKMKWDRTIKELTQEK